MKRKHIILSIANGASLLFFAVMSLLSAGLKKSLPDQQVISRWTDGNERYAQVSVFTDSSSALSIDSIFTARVNVDKKLLENSLVSEKENARIWTDAFSASQSKIVLSTEHGSVEANSIATGGDFFLFHPLDLISGYYYSDDDLMHDRVLIDEVLAWQLYGSSDIVGKPVLIGGKYFYVAGVFRQSENADIEKVYGKSPRMFMSYMGYELLGENAEFTCYEACLPSPVSNLGYNIVTESLSLSDNSSCTVENSVRYSLKKLFEIISDFGMRSVSDNAVVYPYWENAARITEDKSALLLIMQIIGLVLPCLTTVYLIAKLYRRRKILCQKASDAIKRILHKLIAKMKTNRKEGLSDE